MKSNALPIVTIVTASYKKFERIFDTIKSVIDQDYSNIEYIIADDGSPNFPEKDIVDYIISKAPYLNFKIFHSEINRGTVKNVNHALKNSKGDYFFPLSCGDVFFHKDVVSQIVNRFLTTKSRIIVTTRLYHDNYKPICLLPHYDDRKKIEQYDTNQKQYVAFITGRSYGFTSGSAMYYTRDILEEMEYFDERFILLEDAPFTAKFLYKYPFTFAYDLISIWYEKGGVSSGNTINEILFKDQQLYRKEDKTLHLNELKKKDIKKIRFTTLLANSVNKLDKIKIYFSYPILSLWTIFNRFTEKFKIKKDLAYLKAILQ